MQKKRKSPLIKWRKSWSCSTSEDCEPDEIKCIGVYEGEWMMAQVPKRKFIFYESAHSHKYDNNMNHLTTSDSCKKSECII